VVNTTYPSWRCVSCTASNHTCAAAAQHRHRCSRRSPCAAEVVPASEKAFAELGMHNRAWESDPVLAWDPACDAVLGADKAAVAEQGFDVGWAVMEEEATAVAVGAAAAEVALDAKGSLAGAAAGSVVAVGKRLLRFWSPGGSLLEAPAPS